MTQQEQEQYIRENYLSTPIKRLAKLIGRSSCFVYGFMKRNNLVVPEQIIEQRKKDSHYKKGAHPFNKGMKQTDFMTEESIKRTAATRFKTGHEPHNTKYDFYLSVRYSKGTSYWWIRVRKAKFVLLHRWMWQKAYGPIPKGYNVQFKDGNTHNVTLDNLYLTDRKNQAVVNKMGGKSIPYEFRKTIKLINELKSKINEKQDN